MFDPEDRFEDHIADTLTAGGKLCDPAVVEMVVREAPDRIRELIGWGTQFDVEAGELALGREGGHSHDRIVHALGDATGKEVMRAVIAWISGLTNVETWPNTFTLDLLTHGGACRGALVWNPVHGKTLVWAKQTILCTGGVGQVYRETTNPEVATGDGLAIAYRAGAELRDMEFMQFHPTVLYIAGSSRNLITEAIRGAGAWLVDRNGDRFMPKYDTRAELAPRDVVSRAIVAQMEKTRHPNVYLDLRHLDAEKIRARFPGIYALCAEFGLDLTQDRIPVRPGAHYMIGGATVDLNGRTTVPGLWAAGEVTSSGLHGANRLASNSLLEALVYGAHAGEHWRRAALANRRRLSCPAAGKRACRRAQRAVGPDRHPQFAQEPDVAGRWGGARRRATGRSGRRSRPLVPLRAGPAIQWAGRLGTPKHAARSPANDRRSFGAAGNPRRPRPHRLPGHRRTALAAAHRVSARPHRLAGGPSAAAGSRQRSAIRGPT